MADEIAILTNKSRLLRELNDKMDIFNLNEIDINEMIEEYIKNCGDINYEDRYESNLCPILNAISAHSLLWVELLISHGVTINQTPVYCHTALYYAAKSNDYDVVIKLLELGANPLIRAFGEAHNNYYPEDQELTILDVLRGDQNHKAIEIIEDYLNATNLESKPAGKRK